MKHSMPTMQELVEYQVNPNSRMAKEIDVNETQEKLEKIDLLVNRFATWEKIYMDVLDCDELVNDNGITLHDCFEMKSEIMQEIKELATK